MKKVLVASPVRGGCSTTYIKNIIALHFSRMNKIMGGPEAPYDFRWGATSGTSVNLARDELTHLAIDGKFDGILWWDIDLGAFDDRVMLGMVIRLLSHDVDIVCGQYVGHRFVSAFHGATAKDGAQPDENGLLEMAQAPIGFSYMKISALLKIKEVHPHRRYAIKETEKQIAKPDMFEMFPIGVVGPCSDAGKMERLRAIVNEKPTVASIELMDQIAGIVYDRRYETNYLLGEDYYFCKMAREAGVKIYIDNNLLIPHDSNVRLPVNNGMLLDELAQPWRLGNDAKPEQMKELLDKMAPMLSGDIP